MSLRTDVRPSTRVNMRRSYVGSYAGPTPSGPPCVAQGWVFSAVVLTPRQRVTLSRAHCPAQVQREDVVDTQGCPPALDAASRPGRSMPGVDVASGAPGVACGSVTLASHAAFANPAVGRQGSPRLLRRHGPAAVARPRPCKASRCPQGPGLGHRTGQQQGRDGRNLVLQTCPGEGPHVSAPSLKRPATPPARPQL